MKEFIFKDYRSSGTSVPAWIILIFITTLLSGCSYFCSSGDNRPLYKTEIGIPNTATLNCINKGRTLTINKRGDGGEYGICNFDDNRQCEEWALLNGECPDGGVKITGYATPAAQYCAITGGSYKATSQQGNKYCEFVFHYLVLKKEQGTCTFKNGKSCDVWDYYNGKCSMDK